MPPTALSKSGLLRAVPTLCCNFVTAVWKRHLENEALVSPLPQPKQALMGPNEDGVPLLALDISVQGRCHGSLGGFALTLDQAPLQGHLGYVTYTMCINMC